ncbi:MAG TPA: MATE family efflux transporter [Kofleriaceae bacterium]|nr:MATE family efflux transporter [Kofleriaceae bacterium]
MSSRAASLRPLFALALPMVLARATQSVMTFADALFVEHLGTGAIAASATGGFNVFLFTMLPTGTVFIVQSFVSQLAGRGAADDAPRFAWYGLLIAALAGVVGLALTPAIGPVLALTHYSPTVRDLMGSYMAIRMYSITAVVAVEALANWYGGLGNTWMSLVASLVSLAVDLFLSWVLIFGHLGAPAMGVDGAALANTIGSWAGFAFLAVAFYRRWGGAPRGRGRLGLSLRELLRVVRFGVPNGLNWFLEFAAFQIFVNFVFGGLGDDTVAALNVVIAINSVSFMPAFGLASAGAILAGQAIGRGDRDAVWPQVRTTLLVAMTWMGAIGALYLIAPARLMGLFDSEGRSTVLVTTGATMLALSAAWQLFDAVNITLSETLRSAGDTFWTAAARFILAWAVFLPAAIVVVDVWDGGALGAMGCLVGYIALLAGIFAYRFRSGAWRRIELIEPKLV